MILQLANILAGILLTSSFIKSKLSDKTVADALDKVLAYDAPIGVGAFILGILALVERLGIVNVGLRGASFPQALPLIASGLLLGTALLVKQFPFLAHAVEKLEPYRMAVGAIAIASGVGSLLFGCVLPTVCRVPF